MRSQIHRTIAVVTALTLTALLAAADRGLYAAKAAGRDRTVLVDAPHLAGDVGRVGSCV